MSRSIAAGNPPTLHPLPLSLLAVAEGVSSVSLSSPLPLPSPGSGVTGSNIVGSPAPITTPGRSLISPSNTMAASHSPPLVGVQVAGTLTQSSAAASQQKNLNPFSRIQSWIQATSTLHIPTPVPLSNSSL